jgi:hypothetical protein
MFIPGCCYLQASEFVEHLGAPDRHPRLSLHDVAVPDCRAFSRQGNLHITSFVKRKYILILSAFYQRRYPTVVDSLAPKKRSDPHVYVGVGASSWPSTAAESRCLCERWASSGPIVEFFRASAGGFRSEHVACAQPNCRRYRIPSTRDSARTSGRFQTSSRPFRLMSVRQ